MPPPPLSKCRFWDCAGTKLTAKNLDPDWTVGALVVKDGDLIYIEDIIRVRDTPGRVNALILQTAKLDGQEVVIREEEEGGSSGGAVTAMRGAMLVGYNYKGVKATGAKALRWQPFLNRAEVGSVKLLKNERWNRNFLDEIEMAPNGAHDDQLDAVSGAFQALCLEKLASLAAGAFYPLYR